MVSYPNFIRWDSIMSHPGKTYPHPGYFYPFIHPQNFIVSHIRCRGISRQKNVRERHAASFAKERAILAHAHQLSIMCAPKFILNAADVETEAAGYEAEPWEMAELPGKKERKEGWGFSSHAHYQGSPTKEQKHAVSQATASSCDCHGSRGPWQDHTAGLAEEDKCGRERGWGNHPTHWCLLR